MATTEARIEVIYPEKEEKAISMASYIAWHTKLKDIHRQLSVLEHGSDDAATVYRTLGELVDSLQPQNPMNIVGNENDPHATDFVPDEKAMGEIDSWAVREKVTLAGKAWQDLGEDGFYEAIGDKTLTLEVMDDGGGRMIAETANFYRHVVLLFRGIETALDRDFDHGVDALIETPPKPRPLRRVAPVIPTERGKEAKGPATENPARTARIITINSDDGRGPRS